MSTPAIAVEKIGKSYRLGTRERYVALRDVLTRLPRTVLEAGASIFRGRKGGGAAPFWALRDVSFEVAPGEVVGLIGPNGAGKSTLLKILSRITEPTEGRATLRGRVGSLLEVGTGFHPEPTGRENIFLSGALLGMKKAEIKQDLDGIIDFAGVEAFLDTPVKHYSSGMSVRLAFAVAAHLRTEILLVDEVLAVGDVAFQQRCLDKMRRVTEEGRTVILVSHNMAAVRNLCRRALLIDKGTLVFDGDAPQAVARYLERSLAPAARLTGDELASRLSVFRKGEPSIRCHEVALEDASGQARSEFDSDGEITISITYECLRDVPDLWLTLTLADETSQVIVRCENKDDPAASERDGAAGIHRARCTLPKDLFGERRFYVSIFVENPNTEHLSYKNLFTFDVRFQGFNNNFDANSKQAYIRPRTAWTVSALPSVTAPR